MPSPSTSETMQRPPAGEDAYLLIVDDNPIDRQLAFALLSKHLQFPIQTAGDGEEALAFARKSPPALVLTDLRMPKMDGLALVRTMSQEFPQVPVVLITAHGSEETAVEALKAGAAHYVPKSQLSERAADTVSTMLDILTAAQEDQRTHHLRDFWRRTCYEYNLSNDSNLISPLVSRLQQSLTETAMSDEGSVMRIGVALHEAIRNAIHHGNLELSSELREGESDTYYEMAESRSRQAPYQHRRVHVQVAESPQEVRYVIRDEGPGFDVQNFNYDPTDPTNLLRPSGRGLFLIKTFMDEVHFNETGNEITMIHRRTATASQNETQISS